MSDQLDKLLQEIDAASSSEQPNEKPAAKQPAMTDLDAFSTEDSDENMKIAEPLQKSRPVTPADDSDDDMKIIGDTVGMAPPVVLAAPEEEDIGSTRQISLEDLSSAAPAVLTEPSDTVEEDGEEPDEKHSKKSRRGAKGCIRGLVYLIFVLGISFLIAYFAITGAMDVTGMGKSSIPVDITVPEGATTEDVTDLLKSNGLINQTLIFRLYAKVTHADGTFQPGVFTLSANMGYSGIVGELQTEAKRETVTVTIKEGSTIQQIATLMAEKKVCSETDFYKAINQGRYDDYSFIAAISTAQRQDRIYVLEGYLFPDTYEFYVNSSAESAVRKMLDNFGTKVMTDQMKTAIAAKGYTVDQVVNLASIAQWEAGTVDDMSRVMRVVFNRLNNTDEFPRLQLDSTADYVMSIVPTVGGVSVVNTAYDTYEREGLPVGPIGNPGLDAINAVLNPSTEADIVNCYYFATDMKTNITYFAETFEEHEAICKEYGIGTYA